MKRKPIHLNVEIRFCKGSEFLITTLEKRRRLKTFALDIHKQVVVCWSVSWQWLRKGFATP
jgi:hypothetical protein